MRAMLLASGLVLLATTSQSAEPPWADRKLDPDTRAELLLKAMTPDERAGLLHGPMPGFVPAKRRPADMRIGAGYIAGVPRLNLPALNETDASLGVANLKNLRTDDMATAMPSGLSQASSWDLSLVEAGGRMIGAEARAKGYNVMLAGGVNLTRDPRAGRNFEYFGEDPLLSGMLGGAAIRGVQANHIVSTVKHYALNDVETSRNVHSIKMDEADMRESDLLAFQIAIEQGRPGSVMCSYNRINGVHACENDFLLNTVLRGDWGFKGWVMSDWGAVHSTGALMRGLDQQSGEQIDPKPFFGKLLKASLASGETPQSAVDTAARRILRTMFATGVIDHPVDAGAPSVVIDYDAHAKIAQATAEAGMVLLDNRAGLLPIATTARKILVVGGHADVGVLSGGGSSQVRPVGGPALELESSIQSRIIASNMMIYAPSSPVTELRKALPGAQIDFDDGADPARAAAKAKAADLVLVFAERWAVEAIDHADMSLGGGQDVLIDTVAGANAKTVVVLVTDGPVAMPWLAKVGGVLEAWYPGQRGGAAIAAVLTGAVNPSGRLPLTFPASLEQTPNPQLLASSADGASSGEAAVYGVDANARAFDLVFAEGADVGYRWYDKTGAKPLFAFGHGLSYTQFAYDKLTAKGGKTITVRFKVSNRGDRAGIETPQVYARIGGAKRLIGWTRVNLKPGQSRAVSISADPRLLADYDVQVRGWRIAPGDYTVEVAKAANAPQLTGKVSLGARTIKP